MEARLEFSNLFDTWTAFARRLRGAHVCVLSDYDGTLTPGSPGSEPVRIPGETLAQLQRISGQRRATLGILSGRSLAELRSLVPVDHAWYSGLHGHEVRDPQGLERRWYTRREARQIAGLADRIERDLNGVPGVQIERKGGGLSVHFGQVPAVRVRDVQDAVLRTWKTEGQGLRLMPGERELEILPAENRTKGTAVRFILGKIRGSVLPVYFGDDRTDLDAFRAVRGKGINIGVGLVSSPHLEYRVKDPSAVGKALERIADLLEPGSGWP